MDEQRRQNQLTQTALLQFIQSSQPSEDLVSAPPRMRTDTEFLIEALSSSITEFSFDPESNSTFENWYRRYADLFTQDARNLDDQSEIRLLLRKLDTSAHFKYTNYILPRLSSDFTFNETLIKLKKIFDRRQSLFSLRYKCFQLIKQDDMNNLTYMGLINKSCEDIEFNNLTINQLKCLLYVTGMKSSSDMELRTKLLAKLDSEHASITLERLSDDYERLVNIKKDSSMIQKSKDTDNSILVNQVTKKKYNRSKSNNDSSSCNYCGRIHEGHWISVCFKKESVEKRNPQSNTSSGSSQLKKHLIKTNPGENSNKTKVSNIKIHQISKKKRKFIDVQFNNDPIQLQIDSAADATVISKSKCDDLNITYGTTSLKPNDASGAPLLLVGEFKTNITFNNRTIRSTIYVSKNNNLDVFGNDLHYINYLKSSFNSCFQTTLGPRGGCRELFPI